MTGARRRGAAVGTLLLALATPWGLACSDDAPPRRATAPVGAPNLLVLMLDTTAAGRLGVQGYERATTPSLSAFAREARVFDRALATSPWTLPSHASIFTGLYPGAHGATGQDGWLDDRFDTLAERLARSGYDTALFSANPHVSDESNLEQGFAVAEYAWSDRHRDAIDAFMNSRAYEGEVRRSRFAPFKDAGGVLARAFLDWEASRASRRPFFAFLNFMEAHRPWYLTREERSEYLGEPGVEHSYAVDSSYAGRFAYTFGYGGFEAIDLETLSGMYDASIARLDAVVGDLLAEVVDRGLLENTVVVVVADHGDAMGEHGMLGHEYALYDTLLHVPLMIRYPVRVPPGRTSAPVQILDLYPTLLDLAGVANAESAQQGWSLLGLDEAAARRRPVVGEYLTPKTRPLDAVAKRHPDLDRARWLRPLRSIELDGYKLITREGEPAELFAIARDPREQRDLAAAEPERVAAMHAELERWVEATSRPRAEPLRRPPPDDDQRRRLESLGYVEEPATAPDAATAPATSPP